MLADSAQPNKPLERPGMKARWRDERGSAGRSAPSRSADKKVATVVENEWQSLVEDLRGAIFQFGVVTRDSPLHRVEFDSGLTESEIRTVEAHFDFRFPADLCAF